MYPFQIDEPQILDANYLLKCVQGFDNEGIFPYAISIQVLYLDYNKEDTTDIETTLEWTSE